MFEGAQMRDMKGEPYSPRNTLTRRTTTISRWRD
jgi:hypothetical protein